MGVVVLMNFKNLNVFVSLSEVSSKVDNIPLSDGNYLPAPELVARVFENDGHNPHCELTLMFLSDGKPSDGYGSISGVASSHPAILAAITRLTRQYNDRLTVKLIGFGASASDFTFLINMSNTVKLDAYLCMSKNTLYNTISLRK